MFVHCRYVYTPHSETGLCIVGMSTHDTLRQVCALYHGMSTHDTMRQVCALYHGMSTHDTLRQVCALYHGMSTHDTLGQVCAVSWYVCARHIETCHHFQQQQTQCMQPSN